MLEKFQTVLMLDDWILWMGLFKQLITFNKWQLLELIFLNWYEATSYKIISQKSTAFVFDKTYFHQTFIEWVSNSYIHFGISICQLMWLQVWFYCVFWVFLFIFEVPYLHQTFTNCVSNQCTHLVNMPNVTKA